MKLTNIILGFVIFSIVLSAMFFITYEILDEENVDDASNFQGLSGEYEDFAGTFRRDDGTMRDVHDELEQSEASSEERDISIVGGAISGGLTIFNVITNFENIVHNATGEGESADYVDHRIIDGIIIVLGVIIIMVGLHYLRGFKTET